MANLDAVTRTRGPACSGRRCQQFEHLTPTHEGWEILTQSLWKIPLEGAMEANLLPHDSAAMIEGKEEELRQPGQAEDLAPWSIGAGIGYDGVEAFKDLPATPEVAPPFP